MLLFLLFAFVLPLQPVVSMAGDVSTDSKLSASETFERNFLEPLKSELAQTGLQLDDSKMSMHVDDSRSRLLEDHSEEMGTFSSDLANDQSSASGRLQMNEDATLVDDSQKPFRSLGLPEYPTSMESDERRHHANGIASSSWYQVQDHDNIGTQASSKRFLGRHQPAGGQDAELYAHSPVTKKRRARQQLLHIGQRARHAQPPNATKDDESSEGFTREQMLLMLGAAVSGIACCIRLAFTFQLYSSGGRAIKQEHKVNQAKKEEVEARAKINDAGLEFEFPKQAWTAGTCDVCSKEIEKGDFIGQCKQSRPEWWICEDCYKERKGAIAEKLGFEETEELAMDIGNSLQIYVWMMILTFCILGLAKHMGYTEGLWTEAPLFAVMVMVPLMFVCCLIDFNTGSTHRTLMRTEKHFKMHKKQWEEHHRRAFNLNKALC